MPSPHEYLSTSCFHGEHEYCQSTTGSNGETEWAKAPSSCKFCGMPCICSCHIEWPVLPPGYTWSLISEWCSNCDGRKCMDCVLRYVHDECKDDCPFCCPAEAWQMLPVYEAWCE